METKKVIFEGKELEFVTNMPEDEIETNDFFDMDKTDDLSDIVDTLEKTAEIEVVSEHE